MFEGRNSKSDIIWIKTTFSSELFLEIQQRNNDSPECSLAWIFRFFQGKKATQNYHQRVLTDIIKILL